MNPDQAVEEAKIEVMAYLKEKKSALQEEICADTKLSSELVANVLAKFPDTFDWTIKPGVLKKEFFLK